MRDPHVVALHYRLETGPQLAFDDPVPLEKETDAFSLRLTNGQLCIKMTNHFATDGEARNAVEPYLRSWEIVTALERGPNAIKFYFENSKMIDREPPLPGENRGTLAQQLDAVAVTSAGIVPRIILTQYPDPPERFVASSDVVAMWERYEGYANGRELLTEMAWWCLTTIEWLSGGRSRAEARYAISRNVLKGLHRLAHIGDEKTARKRFDGQTLRPHAPAEIAWMEAVVKRIIQRVGEWEADHDAPWPQITMEDFLKQ